MNATKLQGWVVTYDPEMGASHALGPDDPDEEEAVLLFLSYASAKLYAGRWIGANIVEVALTDPPTC